jgi:hypothetical protein
VSGNATTFAWREAEDDLAWEDASRLLDVPPDALVRWSRQLAFPRDVGSDGQPRFRREEIETLRETLADAHSVEGAVQEARRRLDR